MYTLQILLGHNTMTATLKNTAASRDFIAQLPMTLELKDYASTEKVADLPQKLSTQGAPDGYEPRVGDITYYAPWGNLAIFYRDFGYSRGLVNLGRIIEGTENLNFRGAMSATIEIVADESSIGNQ
ncbi:cyclophilin-like fold protein [Bowmanella denitrificans]|uniref:cyclophilin-like fold protein n=1 Tax=Bowmanella denitrificans TaxID=366582 RepID=UPI001FEA983D|nr:cyclophilin-like fold protein [Bowmanella denitrificans]